MVNSGLDIGFKIEDILVELTQDSNAGKLKGLKEACSAASEYLGDGTENNTIEPYQLRETCFLPFQIALESRSAKLATLAVSGLQKLLSDERFHSLGHHETPEQQFPAQFLNTVVATPNLSDEVQVEVMKLLLLITCSESCEIHGTHLLKTAEVCVETYVRAHQGQTKTACRATLTQMLSSVCHRLQESMLQKSNIIRNNYSIIATDSSKVLSQDVVLLLKHFCTKIQSLSSAAPQNHALPLYLEAIQVMLFNLSTAMQQDQEFVNLIWQILCPALIQLLGSPANDVSTRGKPIGYSGYPDEGRGARAVNGNGNKFPSPLIARSIYTIAGELVRLVGTLFSLRPTLESLFHRIILYPPPQHRIEALKVLKEILGSPQRIFDLAGPTQNDREPGTPESPTDQKKSDLDLFKLIMDGIQESCHNTEAPICSASVSCVVALLGTLEDLSHGRGLSDEHIESLSKVKEPLNWREIYDKQTGKEDEYPNEGSPSLKCGHLEDSETESELDEGEKKNKPKHIRWQMDYEINEELGLSAADSEENESDCSLMTPKTVTWASEHEERIIENRDMVLKGKSRSELLRRSAIPKPKSFYATIKSRTDSGLKGKHKKVSPHSEFSTINRLERSFSDIDFKPQNIKRTFPIIKHPLRRTQSTSTIEIKRTLGPKHVGIKVDLGYFDQFRKTNNIFQKHNNKKNHKSNIQKLETKLVKKSNLEIDQQKSEDTSKSPKPILRRTSSFSPHDKGEANKQGAKEEIPEPRGIPRLKQIKQQSEEPRSPSKETTINGIPLSKLPKQKLKTGNNKQKAPKLQPAPKVTPKEPDIAVVEPEKTVEEIEKEGARNFARCLLGILPSVLAATEPWAADESLQQFASDVCEAVTCMTLKRKNVPNFGSIRKLDIPDGNIDGQSSDRDPTLNADGVYKTVYETLTLSFKLHCLGYYKKKGMQAPTSQADFINAITNTGIDVRLSRVWLTEVYRLVTTYDILSKAGYKVDNNDTNRALIGILSEKIYTQHPSRGKDPLISPIHNDAESISPSKIEGRKFARKLLLSTWDQVLDILGIPLDTTTKVIAGNGSIGLALMLSGEEDVSMKKHISRERDMVCLCLDGFRRAARLCCGLEIQSRCDMILSRLAAASCSDFINDKKYRSHGILGPVRLHAAHVLSMDALLAAGLELGSNAPQAWTHVFKCCMYISHLEHASFNNSETSSVHSNHTPVKHIPNGNAGTHLDETFPKTETNISVENNRSDKLTLNGVLAPEDACRAVYALSSAVDNLFDMAATTLPLRSFRTFLVELIDASNNQLFGKENKYINLDPTLPQDNNSIQQQMITMNTLHLYHICDVMLRCARNNNRPLLHVIEAWSIISSHLVEAAYHKARHVSKVALTSIHDILSEILKRRTELPHFWFYESLFKPFSTLMSVDTCDDEMQDQILYTLYELIEGFGSSVKSGWRALFCALGNTQMQHRHALDGFNDGEHRQKLVFNIMENFVNIKSTNMFSQAVVSAILCLLKFLRGGGIGDEEDSFELKVDHNSRFDERSSGDENDSTLSEIFPEQDLCEPTLNVLSQISKRLSNIYIQPSCSIFHGSYSILLVNLTESQDKVWDDTWSQSTTSPLSPDKENKLNSSSTASSIVAIDDTGILRVWFLLLEGLTSNVATSPKRFQPMIIELLFEILRSVTTVPGPHFSMFVISNLVLPMLHSWVQRGSRKKSYWDNTLHNFKHACGLATQLIVEEIGHFLGVDGASDGVPLMLKQLIDLFHECIIQPVEAIARLGCSCLRHLLLTAGPQFTEELWYIVCKGIKQIVDSTLNTVKELINCFNHGSTNVSGENGMIVKIVARRDTTPVENMRLMQIAEQVFLLESQTSAQSPRSESSLDEDDNRSYIFVLCPVEEKEKPDSTKIRITFRALTVSLLSNQVLTQMLGSMLLESADSVKGSIISTITESGLIKRNNEDTSLPGLLCYLSPVNLGILFDCLMETYNVAHEFNNRPGLRSLIQKLARFSTSSNLLRQSITSFAFYLNTLFQISRHDGENFSISNIKRILTGEKVHLDVSPESPNHATKIEQQGQPPKTITGDKYRNLLKGDVNLDWIIRRLYEACNQISNIYQKLHQSDNLLVEQDSGYLENISSTLSTPSPQSSPQKYHESLTEESLDVHKLMKTAKFSPFRNKNKTDATNPVVQSKLQVSQQMRRREDELLHLSAWSQLIISMLELLLGLPTLQFKSVLPAIFPAVTALINTVHDQKVRQLVCDVVRRCGSIYGII